MVKQRVVSSYKVRIRRDRYRVGVIAQVSNVYYDCCDENKSYRNDFFIASSTVCFIDIDRCISGVFYFNDASTTSQFYMQFVTWHDHVHRISLFHSNSRTLSLKSVLMRYQYYGRDHGNTNQNCDYDGGSFFLAHSFHLAFEFS